MIVEGISISLIIVFLYAIIQNWRVGRQTKKLLKNYDENEDKSKQGELRKQGKHRSAESRSGEQGTSDDAISARERLLQIPETTSDGKISSGARKKRKGTRGIFGRRRR